MAEYRLSPLAQDDLDAIFDYTVAQWGLVQANRYVDLIETACAKLSSAPEQAQSCGYIRAGYRHHRIEHHVLYFKATDDGIAVIRILHERMDALRHL
jgi:toxin ParE1/3/4